MPYFDYFYQMVKQAFLFVVTIVLFLAIVGFGTGCAQIGFPTGGDRDTLPPVLVHANPGLYTTAFSGNKISLTFDEFVDVAEVQSNLLVSPLPKRMPVISSNLKTITIRLRDTLKPNTTYRVDFGNAIRDVNEANVIKNFSYVFSTGNHIDSLRLSGKVLMAQTGKTDSTLMALLYKNLADSAVEKLRPDYVAKVNGEGDFSFSYIPAGNYRLYALKDNDGGKTYNLKSEIFAFAEQPVAVDGANTPTPVLYAYAQEADRESLAGQSPASPSNSKLKNPEKVLKYAASITTAGQDLLAPLLLKFKNKLVKVDSGAIILTDTNFVKQPMGISIDSTGKELSISTNWQEDKDYFLLIPKDALTDSLGLMLAKSDTLSFKTFSLASYGSVQLRFQNLSLARKPVLQFVSGSEVKFSYPLASTVFEKKIFTPGDYELRILYDRNGNGIWDPGNYKEKLQPETVETVGQKLTIKANWDNERDIVL